MLEIEFAIGALDVETCRQLKSGFESHSQTQLAPPYEKTRFNWTVSDASGHLVAVLTAEQLWGWLYIDELWVDERMRGQGVGGQLMKEAEAYAMLQNLSGLWLWTQSWQAPGFYRALGFEEFSRFENFPIGHSRIGFRKVMKKE